MCNSVLHHLLKRLAACVLALLLLTYTFSFSAVASVGYSSYSSLTSDTISREWKPISEVISEGDIAEGIWIGIGSAEDLISMSEKINSGESIGGKPWRQHQFRLTASIIFTAEQSTRFEPISSGFSKFDSSTYSNKAFIGVFDGCGFVIDGLQCKTVKGSKSSTNTISYTSLFGLVGAGAAIQNLVIGEHCTFTAGEDLANSCTASVASRVMAGAQLINLLNFAPVSGGTYSGGLVARIDTVSSTSSETVTMTGCTNLGAVSGKTYVGGLVGTVQGNLRIADCVNKGNVSSTGYAGGFFGAGSQAATDDVSEVKIAMGELIQQGSVVTGSTAAGDFFGKLSDPEELRLTDVISCFHRSIGLSFAGETNEVELPEGATVTVWAEDPDEVLTPRFHGLQLGSYEEGKLNLRFVGSVARDVAAYSEIGYVITYECESTRYENKQCTCQCVFDSLLAKDGSGMTPYLVEQLRGENGYLYALTLNGVPLGEGKTATFTVQVYVQKADGTKLFGNSGTVDITVTDGQCCAVWRA